MRTLTTMITTLFTHRLACLILASLMFVSVAIHAQPAGPIAVGGGRGARRHAELGEDVAHVSLDRALAEEQLRRNGLVGATGGDESQHLPLARRQAAGGSGGVAEQRVDAPDVRRGADPCQHTTLALTGRR